MIRMTRQADYAIVLLSRFARAPVGSQFTARGLARDAGFAAPTVSKVLKLLARHGLLTSQRGTKGGYSLARHPEQISVAEVITAVDGPIAITDCSGEQAPDCAHEPCCPVATNWQRVNVAIRGALEGITLAEMTSPFLQPDRHGSGAASGGRSDMQRVPV